MWWIYSIFVSFQKDFSIILHDYVQRTSKCLYAINHVKHYKLFMVAKIWTCHLFLSEESENISYSVSCWVVLCKGISHSNKSTVGINGEVWSGNTISNGSVGDYIVWGLSNKKS